MVTSRPLDMIRVNQSPTLLVFRNSFDPNTMPHRILRVVTLPLVYRFSFSTTFSASPIPASNAPASLRIPVSTRPPNTPHHRQEEFELLHEKFEVIPNDLPTTVGTPSSTKATPEATPLDEKTSDTVTQANNSNHLPTTPPLIHNSDN